MLVTKLLQTLRLGLKSLLLHKLRSALAVLGILIGVTSVIWLVAMGEGVSYQAQQQIKDLGATNIIVRSVKPPIVASAGGERNFFLPYGLVMDDLLRIRSIPTVVGTAPLRELNKKEARYLDRKADVRMVGCRPQYADLNQLKLALGRFISDEDERTLQNVCVLGAETAAALFRYEAPLGRSVILDDKIYVVVGVTEFRDATGSIGGSFSGQEYNRDVYIPLASMQAIVGLKVITGMTEGEIVEFSQITVTVKNLEDVDETSAVIRRLMERYHPANDFAMVVPKELLRQAEVTRMMFNALLIVVAGISLLVGGIGIMNIMLATVTERTREIGIRRALGAKQRDIVSQFLTETLVLSATGGLLGVALGFSVPLVVRGVRWFVAEFFPVAWSTMPPNIRDITPLIAPWSVAAAFFISLFVGVAFGIYPARRASLMDPIDALRHE
ncbi:MAG: ABC transporter permease [Planctomycetales bacterium]|nr:ABC transporter permease [Planctomycetales bacterium]MBN8626709.1 ABC transporter permease [Planctomycetota bacterium]